MKPVCTEYDPELWFPDATDTQGVALARAFCHGCPLIEPCKAEGMRMELGLARHMRHGIWGATTGLERYIEEKNRVVEINWEASVTAPAEDQRTA